MGEEGRKERITMGESANTDDALSAGVGEIRFGHVADATARRGARVWLCLRHSHVRHRLPLWLPTNECPTHESDEAYRTSTTRHAGCFLEDQGSLMPKVRGFSVETTVPNMSF